MGMHAALQINPYYGKTSRSGLLNHFRAVLNEGPGILYNVPGRTGQDIPDDVVLELASHANFLGVKECTGNQRIQVRSAPVSTVPAQPRWREVSGYGRAPGICGARRVMLVRQRRRGARCAPHFRRPGRHLGGG